MFADLIIVDNLFTERALIKHIQHTIIFLKIRLQNFI